MIKIHVLNPSTHPFSILLVPSQLLSGEKWVDPGQVSYMCNLELPINLHVFGLWEKTGVPPGNLQMSRGGHANSS